MLGHHFNIDFKIKEIQKMESELQHSIRILVQSQERRIRNNPNLMQIEILPPQTLSTTASTTDPKSLLPQSSTQPQEIEEVEMIKDSREEDYIDDDDNNKMQEMKIIKDINEKNDEKNNKNNVQEVIEIIEDNENNNNEVKEISDEETSVILIEDSMDIENN